MNDDLDNARYPNEHTKLVLQWCDAVDEISLNDTVTLPRLLVETDTKVLIGVFGHYDDIHGDHERFPEEIGWSDWDEQVFRDVTAELRRRGFKPTNSEAGVRTEPDTRVNSLASESERAFEHKHVEPPAKGTWLSLEQIGRRREVLAKARQLLMELHYSTDPRNPAERFQDSARWVAVDGIREAERELREAENAARKHGGAPVSASVLTIFRTFNRIGPAKLARLEVKKPASIVLGDG